MRAGPLVLLALSVAPVFAAPGSSSPAPPPSIPRSITEIRFKLKVAEEKLTALLEAANVDAALKDVRTYKAYKAEQLQVPKKLVTVDRLLQIVTNEKDVAAETREEAAVAIFGERPLLFDPDLGTSEARRRDQARAKFSLKVVKLLSHPDLFTRSLAKRILDGLWPSASDPAIHGYDARKKESWGTARAAWLEFLTR